MIINEPQLRNRNVILYTIYVDNDVERLCMLGCLCHACLHGWLAHIENVYFSTLANAYMNVIMKIPAILLLPLLVAIILIKTSLPWMHPYHPHCILFHIHLDAIHQCVYARARVQFYNFKHENDISFIVLASVRFLGYYSIEQYRFKTIDKSLRLMMKYFPLEDSISIPK